MISTEELFIKLLKFKSITPSDDGAFDFIQEYMSEFTAIRMDSNGIKNLFLYKKYSKGPHLNFAGHIDVVPPGDGWDSDPFHPIIKENRVFARGTQDMKSGVAAFLNACKNTNFFNGTLSIMLTSDEEGEAKYGTLNILKYLKNNNMLPDFSIVAEPTCDKIFGDSIKVGRRGSINGILKLNGTQGHAAYPEKSINPINKISSILPHIAGALLDNGDEYFAPSQLVITDIRSGLEVTNVTPGILKMMFNIRNSTNTTIKDIENYINNYFIKENFTLKLSQSAKPFITNKESKLITILSNAIEKTLDIKPQLSTAGGTSDARYLSEYGIDVAEFGVVNDSIHAPNENTKIDYIISLKEIFKNVIDDF